jgi:DNA-binding PadR family transcriptional regulator
MEIIREFFLGFIKIHILYHASLGSIYGMELIEELQRHGYQVSPGLIYPTLHSLEKNEYLQKEKRVVNGKVRIYYNITSEGVYILKEAKLKIRELVEEVMQ